jgi:hypothetical protein
MSSPLQPKLMKGAIVSVGKLKPVPTVVVFQYNPAEVSRSLQLTEPPGKKSPIGAERMALAPKETISMKLMIDAVSQLENSEVLATYFGIYPQLSALEMLLYPSSITVLANTTLAKAGAMEIVAPEMPLTLLIWGLKRVVPVRLTSISITEEMHDPNLNPIRAQADVSMKVLSYADFLPDNRGYYLFIAYQVVKETMAAIGTATSLGRAGSVIGL